MAAAATLALLGCYVDGQVGIGSGTLLAPRLAVTAADLVINPAVRVGLPAAIWLQFADGQRVAAVRLEGPRTEGWERLSVLRYTPLGPPRNRVRRGSARAT